jgi:4-amino-4-deoxy-L-arabinose transferase-like glycosyltransferase
MTLVRASDGRLVLGAALVLGLVLRAVIFWHTPDLGTEIVDEQHYATLARNIVAGHGFAWGPGQPTSIRPPLFPGLVAGIWYLAGAGNLQAVRLVQIALALLTTALVYQLGRQLFNPVVGRYAAAATWLYPSLIFFNFTILTETLYVLLLTGFILLSVILVRRGQMVTAFACGLVLGLACLTRSVLWPLPIVLCPLLIFLLPGRRRTRFALSALVLVGYALAVGPWAVRNTRVQRVFTMVDTMGGLNLHMGNYEHTPDDRLWDAISLTGEKHWAYPLQNANLAGLTEGQKDRWAQQRALAYIAANPAISLRRAAIKFADFWGIERELASGFSQGAYRAPSWFAVMAPAAVALSFVLVALMGIAGIWLARPRQWQAHVLVLLPAVAIMAAHTITFGHSRYHIPLIPILTLYGAALGHAVLSRKARVARPQSASRYHWLQLGGSAAAVIALLFIWSRQLLLVDAERISAFFANVR